MNEWTVVQGTIVALIAFVAWVAGRCYELADRRRRIASEAAGMTRAVGHGRYWTCPTCELPVPFAEPGETCESCDDPH